MGGANQKPIIGEILAMAYLLDPMQSSDRINYIVKTIRPGYP